MTIGSNIVSGILGMALGAGVMLYNTPLELVSTVELPKVDTTLPTMVEPTALAVDLPKPKHKIPFYPKDYCEKIKGVDKSLFRDNSMIKMGWTKLQVDTLYKQCKV